MKKLITITAIALLTSCKTTKLKKDIEQTKITRTDISRKGDTLRYIVPKAVYKDTTIYVRNFEKERSNTLKITYDKEGQQQYIDCMSESIRELTETVETLKDNTKTKDTDFKSVNFIYIALGIGLLITILNFLKK